MPDHASRSERPPGPGRTPEPGRAESSADPPGWRDLDRAHHLLRRAARTADRVAAEEGWPAPLSPARFLILAHLRAASAFGLRPRRLARLLEMSPSSTAHHLDVLERSELVRRERRSLHDGRRVMVRLTERGTFAFWRLESALRRGPLSRPPVPYR